VSHLYAEQESEKRKIAGSMISEQLQPEWLDLKALQKYACVSERTFPEAATNVWAFNHSGSGSRTAETAPEDRQKVGSSRQVAGYENRAGLAI
jgi:hypothetical protein